MIEAFWDISNVIACARIRYVVQLVPSQKATKRKKLQPQRFSVNFQCGSVSVFDVNDKAIPKREELEAISFWDQSSSQSLMIF